MSPSHLNTYLRKHKIGCIVNLCSEEENEQDWYKLEKHVAQLNKAQVIDHCTEKICLQKNHC